MTSAPPPSPAPPDRARQSPAAAWHFAWVLWVGLGLALVLLRIEPPPKAAVAALAIGALPGVLGWLLRPRNGHGVGLMFVWAGACAVAMALTGGVSGPLMAWSAGPLLAAAALGGLWRDGATLSFAVLAGVALIQAAGKAGPLPTGSAGFWLSIVGLASTLAAGAAAVMTLTETRAEPEPQEPASPGAAPPVAPTPPLPVAADTDALKAQLVEAQAARDAAESDARAKMRFLANMSHELRTPLNAIMGFSDIMRARLFGELPPKYAEYAELIHESGRHLLDLIGDVLDMSKIEADKYVLQRERFDVREPVNAALRILRVQADEAGVTLRGVLPPAALEVDADRRAIKQMVLNLVSNALKFTPAPGSVTVSVDAIAGGLQILVADTGIGIAPEDLERLGRPYEQAGDARGRVGGTGLGLSLVRAFARLHGGEMSLESRLGEGTAVAVRLPVLVGGDAGPVMALESSDA